MDRRNQLERNLLELARQGRAVTLATAAVAAVRTVSLPQRRARKAAESYAIRVAEYIIDVRSRKPTTASRWLDEQERQQIWHAAREMANIFNDLRMAAGTPEAVVLTPSFLLALVGEAPPQALGTPGPRSRPSALSERALVLA